MRTTYFYGYGVNHAVSSHTCTCIPTSSSTSRDDERGENVSYSTEDQGAAVAMERAKDGGGLPREKEEKSQTKRERM